VVTRLTALRRGLVLITGPAGSGKSTTLAALVTRLLQTRACHVLTLEDPIEYVFTHGRGLVEQIEIGRDAPSFAAALRAALRQAPEIILVGEMRDAETIALALTAAETGHLVFSTLHTGDTSQAIDLRARRVRIGTSGQIRAQLALALQAIVSQVLLPIPDRWGSGGVCEVLLANDAVRKRIRRGETHHLHQGDHARQGERHGDARGGARRARPRRTSPARRRRRARGTRRSSRETPDGR
jgi:twitching motility protein PilT